MNQIDQLKEDLKRYRLGLVALATGIHPHTLRSFMRSRKKSQPSTIEKLWLYVYGEEYKADK